MKKRHHSKSLRRAKERRRRALRVTILVSLGMVIVVGLAILVINMLDVSNRLAISVEAAYQEYQHGAFFLDVRTADEWDGVFIPQSVHIPLDELEMRIDEVPQNRRIVVVCRTGNRSQTGRDILLNAGYEEVVSMDGGLYEWRTRGYPTSQ